MRAFLYQALIIAVFFHGAMVGAVMEVSKLNLNAADEHHGHHGHHDADATGYQPTMLCVLCLDGVAATDEFFEIVIRNSSFPDVVRSVAGTSKPQSSTLRAFHARAPPTFS